MVSAWLHLLVFIIGAYATTSSYSPKVCYISLDTSVSGLSLGSEITSANSTYMQQASNEDDAPLEYVKLPFVFPYMGYNIEHVFVSPNGGLYYTKNQPCLSGWFWSASCALDSKSFSGLLAIFYTDLFPSKNITSTIAYNTGDGFIKFIYDQIPLFKQTVAAASTFAATLWEDGRVDIEFETIQLNLVKENDFKEYLVGMRPIKDKNEVVFTAQQVSLNTAWNAKSNGIYANKTLVGNNTMFSFCPISTSVCVTPSSINLANSPSEVSVMFHFLSFSCLDELDLAVYISSSSDAAVVNSSGYYSTQIITPDDSDTGGAAIFIVTDCAFNTTDPVSDISVYLFCNISTSAFLGDSTTIDVSDVDDPTLRFAGIMWKRKSALVSDGFETLPIPLLNISLYNNSNDVNVGSNCASNCGCSSSNNCVICNNNIADLDTDTCSSDSSSVIVIDSNSYVYQNEGCSNQCNYDDFGINGCCNIETEMDCSGTCFGNALYDVFPTNNLNYCCRNVDACNVCNGTDILGINCGYNISVVSDYPSNSIYTFYDVDYHNSNQSDISRIFVINNSSEDATVWFQVVEGNTVDPYIEVYDENDLLVDLDSGKGSDGTLVTISHDSEQQFNIYSNITRLYDETIEYLHKQGSNLNGVNWSVKSLRVWYRFGSGSAFYVLMKILPSSYNCNTFPRNSGGNTSPRQGNACSNLPGCIFCTDYQDMRVLREVDDDSYSKPSEWAADGLENFIRHQSIAKRQGRRLWTEITPPYAGSDTATISPENGHCVEGWLSVNCSISEYSNSLYTLVSSGSLKKFPYSILYSTFAVICCILFVSSFNY